MDFPADITLRKTRMKFELTFKVVLLFSYQGLLPCESFYILSHHFLFVKNFFKNFFHLLFEDFCSLRCELLYVITCYSICQEVF